MNTEKGKALGPEDAVYHSMRINQHTYVIMCDPGEEGFLDILGWDSLCLVSPMLCTNLNLHKTLNTKNKTFTTFFHFYILLISKNDLKPSIGNKNISDTIKSKMRMK